jgi:hypothetical protein
MFLLNHNVTTNEEELNEYTGFLFIYNRKNKYVSQFSGASYMIE